MTPAEADQLFTSLLAEVPWAQHHIRLFGKQVPEPRLTAWVGDSGAAYTYSGVRREPAPWPPSISALRARIGAIAGEAFNSALLNFYRDGRDSMGWHADDEATLGPAPIIASLSLGAARRFLLRHKADHSVRHEISLTHGSLLVMPAGLQAAWQHAIPKEMRVAIPRLNLTFRRVEVA